MENKIQDLNKVSSTDERNVVRPTARFTILDMKYYNIAEKKQYILFKKTT